MSERAFDAFIFDLDGTLLNTLPDLAAVTNKTLASMGFPQHTEAEILSYIGYGGRRLIEQAVPEGTSQEQMDQAFERWKRLHDECGIRLTREYDGMTETLSALKERGVKLAVLSNKFDGGVQEVIPRYFPGMFDAMHGESETIPRKPDPTGLLLTIEELGTTPERTVYVGDSHGDMVVAKAAGTYALGVSWGYQSIERMQEGGADRIVHAAREMLSILSSCGGKTMQSDKLASGD